MTFRRTAARFLLVVPLLSACGKKKDAPPPPPAAPAVPAEARGESVFRARCAVCHSVRGAGGNAGPDLSRVGATRDALFLQTQLQDPKAYHRDPRMIPFTTMARNDRDALIAYLLSLK